MNILIAILIFTVIIVIHELGHFLLAKKNGIFVTEFSVGMGPRLISLVKTANGYRPRFLLSQHDFEHTQEWKDTTKYSWKLFPIGGSCMMLGEDESIEDDRAFNKKGVWARISVTLAGPIFNFILAFILAMVLIGIIGYDPSRITVVEENSPAQSAGLLANDTLTKINGNRIDLGREFFVYLQMHPLSEQNVELTYVRDGVTHETTVSPRYVKTYYIDNNMQIDDSATITGIKDDNPFAVAGIVKGDTIVKINDVAINNREGLVKYIQENPLTADDILITYTRDGVEKTVSVTPDVAGSYKMGISVNLAREKVGALGVIKYSAIEVKYLIVSTIQSLGQLITGKVSSDDIAGPVGIVNFIGNTYEESKSEGFLMVFLNLANISILLSANLGVMNLLPIPALDGGRLVFLILEVFRGKPVDQSKEGLVHMIGFVALMILMVFVMFNDLSNIF
ncbi:MAG: rasP [Anaerocolumna sp.]|nr:rasP [Anaerocolumna sp.]